jgi:hypothetical protein
MTRSATAEPLAAKTDVGQDLELVSDTVGTARLAIDKGHLVDMTGLDQAVADLYAAAAALPAPHQRSTAQKLSRLAQDLAALADALKTQHDTFERATVADARLRSADAYGNVTDGTRR